jgi:thioredoxin-related protein
MDPQEKLAKRLGVTSYPTYIFFDTAGQEVQRYLNIQSAWKFFDLPRFLDKGWAQTAP